MATERQAKLAADEHARRLARLGVHSLGTAPGERHGRDGFVVVANVPTDFAGELPKALDVTVGKASVSVPVVMRKMEPFKPEKL
jgi:hypothetical protein